MIQGLTKKQAFAILNASLIGKCGRRKRKGTR